MIPAPFCKTAAARAAFGAWRKRLEALGVELADADRYVVGLLASREARLDELTGDLARCKDESRRLRLVAAERLAAGDMQRALELVHRTYGAAEADEQEAGVLQAATGTHGRVVAFRQRGGLGPLAQRLAAAVAGGALTKAELRRRVRGSQGQFLDGLREALADGAIRRTGTGRRGRPFKYERGTA